MVDNNVNLLVTAYTAIAHAAAVYALYILLTAFGERMGAFKRLRILDAILFSALMILTAAQPVFVSQGDTADLHGAILAVSAVILGPAMSIFPAIAGIAADLALDDADAIPSSSGIAIGYAGIWATYLIYQSRGLDARSKPSYFFVTIVAAVGGDLIASAVFDAAHLDDTFETIVFEGLAALVLGGLGWVSISRNRAFRNMEALTARLRQSIHDAAATLGSAMMHRDPVTAHHQERAAHLALAIGRKLGLSHSELEGIELAALMHDIGQIEIPSEILVRPGPLNANEIALVRLHSEIGHKILSEIKFEQPVSTIVHQHHENFDGTGYPANLKGEDTLLQARILRVADLVDAMTSPRPFRPAYSLEHVLSTIEKMRGQQLDPKVVDTCLSLYREDNYEAPKGAYRDVKLQSAAKPQHDKRGAVAQGV